MKKATVLFFIHLFILTIVSSAQNISSRKKIGFDDNWKFHLGNAADPSKDFKYSIATIFSKSGNAAGTAITRGSTISRGERSTFHMTGWLNYLL